MIRLEKWMSPFMSDMTATAAIILTGVVINWMFQSAYRRISGSGIRFLRSRWHPYLAKRHLGRNIILLIPGLAMYIMPYLFYEKGDNMIRILHRADVVFMIVTIIATANSMLLVFLDIYSTTEKNRSHPLHGLIQGLQVILYFIGGIIIIAVAIDKSPTVLLTGLGASAAVLMLVFKDSILGFVAGVQLTQNNMIHIGDWIQLPDGSANGNVEEITLNTVKVRNWDNTLSMIPPYTLVTTVFKNWRGMQESEGRRADKCIYIDINTLEICTPDMISDIRKAVPLMDSFIKSMPPEGESKLTTNVQMYRLYIELYLRSNPDINTALDIIVTQKEATAYGLPIYVYFFTKEKAWAAYERKQSDIFDHLMTMANEFGLRLYQRP